MATNLDGGGNLNGGGFKNPDSKSRYTNRWLCGIKRRRIRRTPVFLAGLIKKSNYKKCIIISQLPFYVRYK